MLLDCGDHNRAVCGGCRRSTAGPVVREVGEVTAAMVAAAPHHQTQLVCPSAVVGQINRRGLAANEVCVPLCFMLSSPSGPEGDKGRAWVLGHAIWATGLTAMANNKPGDGR